MKKLLALCLISYIVPGNSLADEKKPNECQNLHIQISNQTSFTCILTEQNVLHGYLLIPPPTSILADRYKLFDMDQTIFGPSIILSYQCGAETIRFKSQQNYCCISAGTINGEILEPKSNNLEATFTVNTGSSVWSKAGSIIWSIKEKAPVT